MRNSKSDDVQGDSKAMENCGTDCGVSDTYGASIGQDSTNRMGKVSGTGSDPAEQCMPSMADKDRA